MAGKIRAAIADRWRVLYRVYWRPLVAVVAAVYAVISLDSTLSGEFASGRVQAAIRLGNFVPHLSAWIWATIGLALLLILGVEGALRESRRQGKAHAGELAERLAGQQAEHEAALDARRKDYETMRAELEEARRERDQARRELEDARRAAISAPAAPVLRALQPVYDQREPYRQPQSDGRTIVHRIGIRNPPANPKATGVLLEWTEMVPLPAAEAPSAPVVPPQPVPRLNGGDSRIGITLPPGREDYWVIATAMTGTDGNINVGPFSHDSMGGQFRGLLWRFERGKQWRLTYRIAADGRRPVEFSIAMTAVDGLIRCELEAPSEG